MVRCFYQAPQCLTTGEMMKTLTKSVLNSLFSVVTLIALIGHSSWALTAGGPLQRNPYSQPQLITRSATGALNIRNPKTGGYMSRYIPYYTSSVYQAMKSRAVGDMRNVLRQVLNYSHVSREGQLDTLVERCPPGDKNCYQQTPMGYDRARLFLMGYFYLVQVGNTYAIKEAYCNKLYGADEFKGSKQSPRPNYVPDNRVINVEHTWPQSRFTGKYPQETQKSDLHHLFPTDSQLNGIRSSYPFGEVVKDKEGLKCGQSRFGTSDTIRGPTFEPPDVHKGHVARALLYFALRYDMKIEPAQEASLKTWHKQFPVDAEELLRNDEIYKVQGNRNPFIDHPELVDTIADF